MTHVTLSAQALISHHNSDISFRLSHVKTRSWRWVIFDNVLDLLVVCVTVLFEQVVGFGLGWRIWIWIIEEVLDPEKNLLDCDSRLPAFFFIQDGEADGSRRVDIWMEERRHKFAYHLSVVSRVAEYHLIHFGGFVGYSNMKFSPHFS